MTLAPFLLLHPDDNVLICREQAQAGQSFAFDGDVISLGSDVMVGHKIARRDLGTGDKVLRYGAPIGSMTADAKRGDHVHMHNLKSDYIGSHTREATGHDY